MTLTDIWLMPLIILPGVALLIMSTSHRYARIHDEIEHLGESAIARADVGDLAGTELLAHLHRRATYFRDALISLYVSVVLFASGSILGAIGSVLEVRANWVVLVVAPGGILALIFGAVILTRETILSLTIIEHHLDTLRGSKP